VVVYTPYARGIELVRDGQAEVLIGIAKEDAPGLVYPSVEQGVTGFTFFVKAGTRWRYTGPASFEELKKIGTMQGYDYGAFNAVLARHPERVETLGGTGNARRNIHKLLAGRVDAIIHDSAVTQFELKRIGKIGAIVEAGSLPEVQSVYVAFSPKFAGAARYAELMSEGTLALRASGELAKILDRYGLKDWKK
jgi:polar amino acid transport system substrate-binding protein